MNAPRNPAAPPRSRSPGRAPAPSPGREHQRPRRRQPRERLPERLALAPQAERSRELMPVLAIVGRPNVGKSTLFNRLTGARNALVADLPGLTRDRLYGVARNLAPPVVLIDTGGIGEDDDVLALAVERQVERALAEADAALLMVDAANGLTAADEALAARLRASAIPVILVANKIDGTAPESVLGELHALGLGEPLALSARHGRGMRELTRRIAGIVSPGHPGEASGAAAPLPLEPDRHPGNAALPGGGPESAPEGSLDATAPTSAPPSAPEPRIAVLGRPNVGKSTFINRVLGEERLLALDRPGTTRDSILVAHIHRGSPITLIDTAGIRRRSRVEGTAEKFSVVRALQALELADAAIVLLDAAEGVTEQDSHLLGLALEAGCAVVVGLNKWDSIGREERARALAGAERRLAFVDHARVMPVSALAGSGTGKLLDAALEAARGARADLPTPALTRVLEEATTRHPPPLHQGRRARLRYAHQGGVRPPVIVIHGTKVDAIPDAYTRYLVRAFRSAFDLRGTPIRIEYRQGENPFAGRRNELTPRQLRRRARVIRHARRRK